MFLQLRAPCNKAAGANDWSPGSKFVASGSLLRRGLGRVPAGQPGMLVKVLQEPQVRDSTKQHCNDDHRECGGLIRSAERQAPAGRAAQREPLQGSRQMDGVPCPVSSLCTCSMRWPTETTPIFSTWLLSDKFEDSTETPPVTAICWFAEYSVSSAVSSSAPHHAVTCCERDLHPRDFTWNPH